MKSEVESVIVPIKGVELVNVYGVVIPNNDGRAGMAALVINDQFSFSNFYQMF